MVLGGSLRVVSRCRSTAVLDPREFVWVVALSCTSSCALSFVAPGGVDLVWEEDTTVVVSSTVPWRAVSVGALLLARVGVGCSVPEEEGTRLLVVEVGVTLSEGDRCGEVGAVSTR